MGIRMQSEKRDAYMDFLKGIAVLAVVVGHSIVDIPKMDFLFQIIYSFHMPLLIFLSAYIEEENSTKYAGREGSMLLRRMCGLLLPYLSWTVIYAAVSGQLLSMDAVQLGRMLTGYTQNGLWFFPVLFGLKIMHFLYWIVQKKLGQCTVLTSLLICFVLEVFAAILAVFTRQPYAVNILSYAIPYFAAVLLVDHEILQKLVETEWLAAGCIFLYGILFLFFSFQNPDWTTQALRIVLSMCVIVLCCRFRSRWREHAANRAVCVYGRNSLAVYVLHVFFMDYKVYLHEIRSAVVASLLAAAAACGVAVVCIGIARIIGISSWWRLLLFGESQK